MEKVMIIAQLSDLHVLDMQAVTFRDFLNKRLVGGANLLTGRRNAHPMDIAERLIEDVSVQAPDHVVVTGDVTNLSLPGEFQQVSKLLRPLGSYDNLTVIPGNHDVYTKGAEREQRFERYFGHLLFGEDAPEEQWIWPAVKDLGEVVVVGLCSGLKTALLSAWGRVGNEQLDRLEEKLSSPELKDRFTMALVHHNFHRRDRWHERTASLRDRDDVLARLMALKVNVVCHGHTHRANRFTVERDGHSMLIIGSGSSTQNSDDPKKVARYNLYTIEDDRFHVRTRVYDKRHRRFEWLV
jgi:3',5'-cyclic AMP phosphodiesterase CpdA